MPDKQLTRRRGEIKPPSGPGNETAVKIEVAN
jgi:hypothetical protein